MNPSSPSPVPPQPDATDPQTDVSPSTTPQTRSTASKLLGLLLVVICFEAGVFLLVFPWMDAWPHNWFASQSVWLMDLFESNYFRGALSGLGAVNIYISFSEMIRLLRG